jgi:Tfp pilus assembly protein PilF
MAGASWRRCVGAARWRLRRVAMLHRTGVVPVGQVSVGVAVSSGHRAEAFAAGRWLIDRLKKTVPIWKREHFRGGRVWIGATPAGGTPRKAARRADLGIAGVCVPGGVYGRTTHVDAPLRLRCCPDGVDDSRERVRGVPIPRHPGTVVVGPRVEPPRMLRDGRSSGQLALERDDPEAALPAFETAVAADPGTAMLRVRLASLYVRAGKLEKALEQANAAVQLEPDNLEALALQGGILSSLGRDDEAILAYERMRQINPGIQDPYLYLSALYAKRGDTDRAIATLKELVARNPGSVLGYYYLGRVHAAARQFDKAERYYLDALEAVAAVES